MITIRSSTALLTNQTREFCLLNLISFLTKLLGRTFGALIHILKGSLGAGILAIPNAFNNAGLLFGSVMIFIIGAVITHCAWVLVRFSIVAFLLLKIKARTKFNNFYRSHCPIKSAASHTSQFFDTPKQLRKFLSMDRRGPNVTQKASKPSSTTP